MKTLIQKITILFSLFATLTVMAQGDYSLEIEQEVQGTNLMMDLYIQKTAGVDFALSSCNFAVFIDTANLDINGMSKVTSEDGPWDNGTAPSSYLDLLLGKGADFLNLNTRRNTSGSTVGFDVTSTRTKIGRISIPIKNSCGTNNAKWHSGPVAQTKMPLRSIKQYANFVDAPVGFPLCELPTVPSLDNPSNITEICEGSFVSLSTDATSDIQWYKDAIVVLGANASVFNVSESGLYTVEAVNCTACRTPSLITQNIVVNPQPLEPSIEFIGNVLVTDATSDIQWFKNGVAIDGATSSSYEPMSDGLYVVKNSNTCGEKTSSEFKIETTGITDDLEIGFSAYPNPYKGSTVIAYNVIKSSNVSIELFDAIGKKISTIENSTKGSGEYTFNFSAAELGFSEGIYFVKLTIGEEAKTIKLVELK